MNIDWLVSLTWKVTILPRRNIIKSIFFYVDFAQFGIYMLGMFDINCSTDTKKTVNWDNLFKVSHGEIYYVGPYKTTAGEYILA